MEEIHFITGASDTSECPEFHEFFSLKIACHLIICRLTSDEKENPILNSKCVFSNVSRLTFSIDQAGIGSRIIYY